MTEQQWPKKLLYNLSATQSLLSFHYDEVERFFALKIRTPAFYGCTLVFETQISPILHLI